MSRHYSANQYEVPFKPSYLRNWEVPKYHCGKPRSRKCITTIISNPKGHLLPRIPRSSTCKPFGDYVGTWHLPNKITRELANKLNGSAEWPILKQKCRQDISEICKKQDHATTTAQQKLEEQTKKSEKQIKEDELVLCPIHGWAKRASETE
ncbi:unnamed protein product [Ceutorhynchus assimilis]|uniref:Cilia- and flagella-associated protein 126 n=1 Tax=Ceutorhynchus assimilis TaxID=467358 RepID=A0A9N9MLD4_9CUCU|nr:unnamed protein product [Ceutorhynchus assimilis]